VLGGLRVNHSTGCNGFVLCFQVEQLSSEIHRYKNTKTKSLHVQVDVEDLLNFTIGMPVLHTGPQLRKSEQNGFYDNFLISQPNPMM